MVQKLMLKNDNLTPLIIDNKITRLYRTKLLRRTEWSEDTLVPITYDVMFKTMIANTKRKVFLCRLLSHIFNLSEKEVFENFTFIKGELDKDNLFQKGERVDLVGKLYGSIINVEMNKTSILDRNVEYLERISREEVLVGCDDSVYKVNAFQINLNDVCYKDDEIISYFWMKDGKGRAIGNKVLINISIPLIRKKFYTEGAEKLNELERLIFIMTTTDKREAKKLARRDELMKRYIKEAKQVEEAVLPYYYDLEVDYKTLFREEGREEGHEEGRKEGRKEEREYNQRRLIASAKRLYDIGTSLDDIKECLSLSKEEINEVKSLIAS